MQPRTITAQNSIGRAYNSGRDQPARVGGTMIAPDDSIAIHETAVFRELDGEVIVLNLETGDYFGLDEVGARFWSLLGQHPSVRQVVDIMSGEYNVARDTLEADLLGL